MDRDREASSSSHDDDDDFEMEPSRNQPTRRTPVRKCVRKVRMSTYQDQVAKCSKYSMGDKVYVYFWFYGFLPFLLGFFV